MDMTVRILVVDDEEDLRDVLSYQLKPLGVIVETAENGRIGLELAKKNGYCAILSDISMPEMSGLDFLAGLRKEGVETPFVILTGFGDKVKAVEALRLGAFDFLEKPWEPEKLRQSLKKAVEHGKLLREIEGDVKAAIDELGESVNDETVSARKKILLMKAIKKQSSKKAG